MMTATQIAACREYLAAKSSVDALSRAVASRAGIPLGKAGSMWAARNRAWERYTVARQRLLAMRLNPEQAHAYIAAASVSVGENGQAHAAPTP